ncbi:carbon-nitrogen hydrolase family protein [Malaciobacter mytili]|uniref:carbon-nitrogen hydrolase family protein n=1 Tax=Malaciobacter mytili TaxID=603050 RepID=UPI00100C23DE|nr:carbon-nitrogen hydrolase family protein [Malaciobacter mytili]RXI44656.1 carbon-nitrogen hydrolase family protein [Malaciobacter mytili]
MNLITLQTNILEDFEQNLLKLKKLINKAPKNSLILASELALSGYSYKDMKKASKISLKAKKELLELSKDKTIALTLIIEENNNFFNRFFLFSNNKIVHTQDKYRLFELGEETNYFKAPNSDEKIKIFNVKGLKIATLICFELRFTQYWERLKGADIILIPAMWGKNRKEHFETLTRALAIANQCYVIASNSAYKECCKSSAIITPFGEVIKDDRKEFISLNFEKQQIKKMRKYLKVGIENE